jgi:hypothetical protein
MAKSSSDANREREWLEKREGRAAKAYKDPPELVGGEGAEAALLSLCLP